MWNSHTLSRSFQITFLIGIKDPQVQEVLSLKFLENEAHDLPRPRLPSMNAVPFDTSLIVYPSSFVIRRSQVGASWLGFCHFGSAYFACGTVCANETNIRLVLHVSL